MNVKLLLIDRGNVKKKSFFKEYGSSYLMILPSFVMFILMVVYPLGWVLSNAVFDTDGVTYKTFVGMKNFITMFGDKYWWNAVLNTFQFSLRLLILQVPIAIVLAAILNSKVIGKGFLRVVYYLPAITSAAVMSLVFSFMFSPYNGVINMMLTKFGRPPIEWLNNANTAMWSCVIFSLWASFGHNMLLILSGMQGISDEVYESASLDGASKINQFFSITIPMLSPVLKTVLMLSLIGSLQAIDSILIMTNGGPSHGTETMSLYIYNMFFAGSSIPAYGYGAALGIGGSVVIGVITVIYNVMSKKLDDVM